MPARKPDGLHHARRLTRVPGSRPALLLMALTTFGAVFASARQERWPFGTWQRLSDAPVISPQGNGWESAGTFNPSVVMHDGHIVMLYRAQDANGTSRLGYASSTDGIHFTRRPEPVLSPDADYERG